MSEVPLYLKAEIVPGAERGSGPPESNRGGRSALYRGTSLIRNSPLLGPYSRTVSRALWWPPGGGLFLISEVPLYGVTSGSPQVEDSRVGRSARALVRGVGVIDQTFLGIGENVPNGCRH